MLFRSDTRTHTDIHRHTQTHTGTHRHTQTHTDTHRHRYTQTHTYTHRQTETHTDRHRCQRGYRAGLPNERSDSSAGTISRHRTLPQGTEDQVCSKTMSRSVERKVRHPKSGTWQGLGEGRKERRGLEKEQRYGKT